MSSETVTARLAGGYPFTQLDRLIRGLAPLLSLNERRAVVLDLAGLVFISPSGLALLVATMKRLEDLALIGEGGYVHLPKSPMTRNRSGRRLKLSKAGDTWLIADPTPGRK